MAAPRLAPGAPEVAAAAASASSLGRVAGGCAGKVPRNAGEAGAAEPPGRGSPVPQGAGKGVAREGPLGSSPAASPARWGRPGRPPAPMSGLSPPASLEPVPNGTVPPRGPGGAPPVGAGAGVGVGASVGVGAAAAAAPRAEAPEAGGAVADLTGLGQEGSAGRPGCSCPARPRLRACSSAERVRPPLPLGTSPMGPAGCAGSPAMDGRDKSPALAALSMPPSCFICCCLG